MVRKMQSAIEALRGKPRGMRSWADSPQADPRRHFDLDRVTPSG